MSDYVTLGSVGDINVPVRKGVRLEHSDTMIYGHTPDQCGATVCSLHNRSDHPMRAWKQRWNQDLYRMERRCPHGWEHPDPDHIAYIRTFMPHIMVLSTMRHPVGGSCDCCDKICKPLLAEQSEPTLEQQRNGRRYVL